MSPEAELVRAIAKIGEMNHSYPSIQKVEPFRKFIKPDGTIDQQKIDSLDGPCTGRELLTRYLVLGAVVDQGPDTVGVRQLLTDVTNTVYKEGVWFLHRPLSFFENLKTVIDAILHCHKEIKNVRAAAWAQENHTKKEYNLFLENTKQVLSYASFRWGVPLTLPLLLEKDCNDESKKQTVLMDYLESWSSAETMSQQLKDHERYGLGKAIGDKACHLFTKWMVSSFRLSRSPNMAWGKFSYEVPYDSNAGRVLWRTGFLLKWAPEEVFVKHEVIQRKKGKNGLDYIRVTNIRGVGALNSLPKHIHERYVEIAKEHMKTHSRPPRKVEIQRIQHAYLLEDHENTGLGVADFDEGLMHIGTRYCFNHSAPLCDKCPIGPLCEGRSRRDLIENYRT